MASFIPLNDYWGRVARHDAETVIAAVNVYQERTGTYPATLGQVGIDPAPLKYRWKLHYAAGLTDREAHLYYASAFTPFDIYFYDFNSHEWTFQPD